MSSPAFPVDREGLKRSYRINWASRIDLASVRDFFCQRPASGQDSFHHEDHEGHEEKINNVDLSMVSPFTLLPIIFVFFRNDFCVINYEPIGIKRKQFTVGVGPI